MLIKKTLELKNVELKMAPDGRSFTGYASVFDGVDSYGDTIVKGAYAETLKSTKPKMFFNHAWDMPIGKWNAEEDSKGLLVHGELTPGLSLSSDVAAALKHGTIDGLSVGGYVRKGDYSVKEDGEGRNIHKWSSLMEISVVSFPADNAARIDGSSVKNEAFDAELESCVSERDVERLLRDSGLSKREAMAVISTMKGIFKGRDAAAKADFEQAVLSRINKLI